MSNLPLLPADPPLPVPLQNCVLEPTSGLPLCPLPLCCRLTRPRLPQNCVLEPMSMYKKNLFTTNETGLAGITHLDNKDFGKLIERALALPGFDARSCERGAALTMSR